MMGRHPHGQTQPLAHPLQHTPRHTGTRQAQVPAITQGNLSPRNSFAAPPRATANHNDGHKMTTPAPRHPRDHYYWPASPATPTSPSPTSLHHSLLQSPSLSSQPLSKTLDAALFRLPLLTFPSHFLRYAPETFTKLFRT